MDIYSYLRKDHRKISEMMEELLTLRSPERRQELFREITQEWLLHAETEQATFYAFLENRRQTEGMVRRAEKEHDEIKKYISVLLKLPIDGKKWMEQFGEFKHAIMHHVKEEEEVLLEKAKQILSHEQAMQLARDMESLKRKLSENTNGWR